MIKEYEAPVEAGPNGDEFSTLPAGDPRPEVPPTPWSVTWRSTLGHDLSRSIRGAGTIASASLEYRSASATKLVVSRAKCSRIRYVRSDSGMGEAGPPSYPPQPRLALERTSVRGAL